MCTRSGGHVGGGPGGREKGRLAAELGIVALFHRRIKRVHVDMNDLASGHLANILFPGSDQYERLLICPAFVFLRTRLPLIERRAFLKSLVVVRDERIRTADYVEAAPKDLLSAVREQGLLSRGHGSPRPTFHICFSRS